MNDTTMTDTTTIIKPRYTVTYYDEYTEIDRSQYEHRREVAMLFAKEVNGTVYDNMRDTLVANYADRQFMPSRVGAGKPRVAVETQGCVNTLFVHVVLPVVAGYVLFATLNYALDNGLVMIARETFKAAVMLIGGGGK